MYLLLLAISIPYCIMMFVYRFSHSGKVCSGDFRDNNLFDNIYLIGEGRFFYVLCMIQIVVCSCACCVGCCIGCAQNLNKDKEWYGVFLK